MRTASGGEMEQEVFLVTGFWRMCLRWRTCRGGTVCQCWVVCGFCQLMEVVRVQREGIVSRLDVSIG